MSTSSSLDTCIQAKCQTCHATIWVLPMYRQSILADIYEYLIKCTAVPELLNYGRVRSNSVGTSYIIVADNNWYSLVSEKNFCWKILNSQKERGPSNGSFELGVWLEKNLIWYKKPRVGEYPSHQNHFESSRWRMELLGIGGSMGTVPRRESVSDSSMRHREL